MIETFDINKVNKSIKISKAQSIKDNIVFYGDDNHYPIRYESLIDDSETAQLCVKTKTKFLATPFEDDAIGNTPVGRTWINRVYTLNQFVREIAASLSKNNGAYILVVRNLAGETVSVSVADFQKVRFTEFDDGNKCNAVYMGDFSNTITGKKGKKKFMKFPLYNANIEMYKELAKNYGTTVSVYPLFLDTTYYYPRNSFESVTYDMATEAAIQENRYNEITYGSPSKLIIRTDFSKNESEKRKQIEQIRNFAGTQGERVLIIKSSFDEDGNPISNGYSIDTVPDTRDLDQFTTAEQAIAGNIRKALQIPSILVAPNDGATVDASAAQMRAAVDYYNDLVRCERLEITEALNDIFRNTSINFGSKNFTLSDFQITERENN